VPGPQSRLFAGTAPVEETYPVVPLGPGHLLAVGVTSYDGDVYFGLTADRRAVGDLDVLVQCLEDAVQELVGTTEQVGRRQPTRARRKKAAPCADPGESA